MIRVPLYSRGRPLKNLLNDFSNLYNVDNIRVRWDYDNSDPVSILTEEERPLYEAFVRHWYFADIGFDFDEQFIYRFNAIYSDNIQKYLKLIKDIELNGYSYEKRKTKLTIEKSGDDTTERSVELGGTDEYTKGVTTTSEQDTSNVGDKLARASQNEKLSVAGTSTTTVTDTGKDTTVYGKTETGNNKVTYNHAIDNDGEEVKEKLTAEELLAVQRMNSVLNEFALCFEKIFMEVL